VPSPQGGRQPPNGDCRSFLGVRNGAFSQQSLSRRLSRGGQRDCRRGYKRLGASGFAAKPCDRRWAGWLPVVVALFVAAPMTHQPIYDGLGFPDEAYRYVVAPVGAPLAPVAVAATQQVRLVRGTNEQPVALSTDERGPQALLVLRTGTIRSGSDTVAVTLTPTAPPAAVPGARLVGNAYDIEVSSPDGQPVRTVGEAPLVQLRVPQGSRPPVALLQEGLEGWRSLPTNRTGTDIYSAALPGLGRVVAAQVTDSGRLPGPRAHQRSVLLPSVLFAGLAVLVLLVVVIRRRAGPDRSPHSD
jgi:hypothetical protein